MEYGYEVHLAPPISTATETKLATAAISTKMKIANRAESSSLASRTADFASTSRIRAQMRRIIVHTKAFQTKIDWAGC